MTGTMPVPPLVLADECARLRQRIAAVARGGAVLLSGGGRVLAAGRIDEGTVRERLRTLTRMEVVLGYATGLPVVTLGWTAGEYPASAAVLNLVRALVAGPAEDLRHLAWERAGAEAAIRHRDRLDTITRGLAFLAGHGLGRRAADREVFAGHECRGCAACATAGHLLWLSGELRDPAHDSAQWEHLAALSRSPNALAVRVGPATGADAVLRAVDRLDPGREPGRLTFVVRLDPAELRDRLPPLVEKVRAAGAEVCWVGDPGRSGAAVRAFAEALRSAGGHAGGVHLEMSAGPGPALDLALDFADAFRAAAGGP
ncbi:3-deoxy-7-phosphoheptulonate synthase [Actinoplanes teichomyceticus]|uniref:Phospho-2-dehydro-3-deoxyheptonate aldolase n=1 Tax=Actinoplanes teichomyceticus TaxID=1867 RepID=A0A561WBI6_ACTTI|nr:3-deoxy-7-phosphoheptulonate synthase [Actinoplanes teichomyceticus]TWG21203.1 3-deoxy-D-arabinoheptulosonate-7-phosphate synthase [Actinoplanes teichomyceticus]GIF15024.1 phospho-2-dehydro-3-deoxyheptonate aldolase [Actinoplanes teichomyceticus]